MTAIQEVIAPLAKSMAKAMGKVKPSSSIARVKVTLALRKKPVANSGHNIHA